MAAIMPVTIHGAHVFHPLQGVTGLDPAATAPAPPFNDELLDQDDDDDADEEDSQDRDKYVSITLSSMLFSLLVGSLCCSSHPSHLKT